MKIGKTRLCRNNCIFCFVDQLPEGLRPSLYEKDDDWRMSLLYGNYVTFTNVSEREIRKIIRRHYSPLYVSVHAVEPVVRRRLLGCGEGLPNADILPLLRRLRENGIALHGQVVLCPGINDGEHLARTVEELHGLLRTLAVVPVGLTKFQASGELKPVTPGYAAGIIDIIEGYGQKYLDADGTRFVWCADEFYALCGRGIPEYGFYESFSQIDNGVGMLRAFEDEFAAALADYREAQGSGMPISGAADIATGVSAYPYIVNLCGRLTAGFPGMRIKVHKIINGFLGESVTVAGLITGGDIAAQLKDKMLSGKLLIPDTMLKAGSDVFLDDMTAAELQNRLSEASKSVKVVPVPVNGAAFFEELIRAGSQ